MEKLSGFVNINKPRGITSSDAVVYVRRILSTHFKQKIKVGHLGTLDPLATGVLPIAYGTATRLFDFAQLKIKEYSAKFVFGKTTDTLDSAGTITEDNGIVPKKEQIEAALLDFQGNIKQIPPQYSAKSVSGVRAYDIARRGGQVELESKSVTVHEIMLTEQTAEDEFAFNIRCGSGCYIRSLARDIANKCGTVAYMSELNRTKSGEFKPSDSVDLKTFEENPMSFLIETEFLMKNLSLFKMTQKESLDFLNGIKMNLEIPSGFFKVYEENKFLGLGENVAGHLKLIRL